MEEEEADLWAEEEEEDSVDEDALEDAPILVQVRPSCYLSKLL